MGRLMRACFSKRRAGLVVGDLFDTASTLIGACWELGWAAVGMKSKQENGSRNKHTGGFFTTSHCFVSPIPNKRPVSLHRKDVWFRAQDKQTAECNVSFRTLKQTNSDPCSFASI